MNEDIDAIIRVRVPKWQVGEEAQVFFPDTMSTKGKCEPDIDPKSYEQGYRRGLEEGKQIAMVTLANALKEKYER